MVYGSRFLRPNQKFHLYQYIGNKILNFTTNVFLFSHLTDVMTCYKAFRAPVLKSLSLKADRFAIETEITAEVYRRGYKVQEVPISYQARTYKQGKKIKWTDFFNSIYWLLKAKTYKS